MKEPYGLFILTFWYTSTFQGLLNKDKSFSYHEGNIQSLAIFCILNLLHIILELKKNFVAPKIRNKVTETIKMSLSLESFKSEIKKCKSEWVCPLSF